MIPAFIAATGVTVSYPGTNNGVTRHSTGSIPFARAIAAICPICATAFSDPAIGRIRSFVPARITTRLYPCPTTSASNRASISEACCPGIPLLFTGIGHHAVMLSPINTVEPFNAGENVVGKTPVPVPEALAPVPPVPVPEAPSATVPELAAPAAELTFGASEVLAAEHPLITSPQATINPAKKLFIAQVLKPHTQSNAEQQSSREGKPVPTLTVPWLQANPTHPLHPCPKRVTPGPQIFLPRT